ncbi:MAG: hypothetical protein J6039_03455 [Alphaproteobacteria bacterium]|nr:hypothetical protein [Alphaproteobacteria bacterium]
MTYLPTEIAEMVCTRISHDLGGSIGALASSLELLSENNNIMDEDTLQLFSISTSTLKARQQFFRVAFGSNGKITEGTDLQKLCADYLATVANKSTPLKLKLNGASAELAKIICLCVMIMAEICIKGGDLTIDINKSGIIMKVVSDFKLSAAKIETYNCLINNEKIDSDLSQFAALIYLKELLGNKATFKIQASENSLNMNIV